MEKKKDKINFEDNIKKLETIVRELESGNVALDDALEKFNEAFKISKVVAFGISSSWAISDRVTPSFDFEMNSSIFNAFYFF